MNMPSDIPAGAALPTAEDVAAAARRIAGVAVRTPLLTSLALDRATGGRIFIKPEVLQRTGSFKFRGAYNRLSQLNAAERAAGVVAVSSGNHAQGVAAAAQLLGIPAAIVMPTDAPRIKVANTRGYGAEVIFFDRATEDRDAIARGIAAERGRVMVPPYDDPHIIAGQGTAGLEIAEDLGRLGAAPDYVIANTSGGGLVSGIALAVKARFPDAQIVAGEPEGFDDHVRSFAAGERRANAIKTGSICDALLANTPGVLTFAINTRLGTGAVAVSDREVGRAMAFAFQELKLVVEPGGAVGLAALLTRKIDAAGKVAVVVLSGGNVDRETFISATAEA